MAQGEHVVTVGIGWDQSTGRSGELLMVVCLSSTSCAQQGTRTSTRWQR